MTFVGVFSHWFPLSTVLPQVASIYSAVFQNSHQQMSSKSTDRWTDRISKVCLANNQHFYYIYINTFHSVTFLFWITELLLIFLKARVKVSWPLSTREIIVHYFLFEYFQDDLIVVLLNSVTFWIRLRTCSYLGVFFFFFPLAPCFHLN